VLHEARWKHRTQKIAKNRHLRTIAQLCRAISSQLRHASTIGKKLLNNNISPTCSHNMVNFGPLAAEIVSRVRGTATNFNGFASWLRYCSDVAHRRPTKLCTTYEPLLGLYTLYIFGSSCPLTEFFPVQNSLCVQDLRCSILAALRHGTPAAGVSQTLWRGTRNGITGLSQRASPIFGRAAITLGTGPHSTVLQSLSKALSMEINNIILINEIKFVNN